ncbi:uncharacterized protein LOC113683838 [Pocillopora damicornis]|uniref:uncharacterized protein LOC113683838 n=1 Tax=Pocillopora damicornis TaxID=46731 RepID=UPI000F556F24|nr:uncharacterized protein LOC113683838 [Pocillopora damicornis]
MAFIGKIFLTIVALQLALVLAKPYEPHNVDLYNSNEPMDEYFHKREELARCNHFSWPAYHKVNYCRESCRAEPYDTHVKNLDYLCTGGFKCCSCNYQCPKEE